MKKSIEKAYGNGKNTSPPLAPQPSPLNSLFLMARGLIIYPEPGTRINSGAIIPRRFEPNSATPAAVNQGVREQPTKGPRVVTGWMRLTSPSHPARHFPPRTMTTGMPGWEILHLKYPARSTYDQYTRITITADADFSDFQRETFHGQRYDSHRSGSVQRMWAMP